jgi:TPR repeat protein
LSPYPRRTLLSSYCAGHSSLFLQIQHKQGSRDAANDLGVAFANGWGVPLNMTEARRRYAKAAPEGNQQARNNLASLNQGPARR